MNRKELVQAVADRADTSQTDVDNVVRALVDVVTEQTASGNEVTIQGFVKFEKVQRAARTGRNPQTGEEMQIPASAAVKVSALSGLKSAVKGG
jgi:DNA-binding protein HU-beta